MSGRYTDLAVLGPIEVRTGSGAPVGVPGGKPLALLALLLCRRGAVLPIEMIAESLWGDRLPEHPANAVHLAASRLRRAIGDADGIVGGRPGRSGRSGDGLLVAAAGGYSINPSPGTLDSDRFETLARAGRGQLGRAEAVDAAATLRRALALWRGPALEQVHDEPFARSWVLHLEEQRLAALADRIDADLRLGRNPQLVPELTALVDTHPLRERFRAQQMLALYGSGRQAEALASYQQARRLLVAELGVEPSAELREAERLVLHQEPLPQVVPPSVTAGPAARRRTVSCVVVLPADDLDRLDPEDVHDLLLDLRERVGRTCRAHHGILRAGDGPAVCAVFGWPSRRDDAARRAAACATELSAADLCVGVATGVVVTARDGELPVLGQVLVRAEQLARAAGPGRAAATIETWELARDDLGPAERAQPVGPGLLLPTGPPRTGSAAPADGDPIVGRDRELNQLLEVFEQVETTGRPGLVTVQGEPGIGKTRLALALADRLGRRATLLHARCRLYGDGMPFRPVLDLLDRHIGIGALPGWLTELGLEPEVAAGCLAALGLPAPGRAAGPGSGNQHWALTRLLLTLADRGPVLLVVDDLHAAEPELAGLLEQVSASATGALLTLVLARPTLTERHPGWPPRGTLSTLGPLDEQDSRRLARLRSQDLPEHTLAQVVETAAGNPLFVEQLLRHLSESPRHGPLPIAVQSLLTARLDQLPADERLVLELGSVEGEVFHPEHGAVDDPDGGEPDGSPSGLAPVLDALIRRDLVVPVATGPTNGRVGYAFRHRLIREAAYAGLTRTERAQQHERVADRLAGASPSEPDLDARRGTHLEQAHDHWVAVGDPERRTERLGPEAGRLLARAGDQAHLRGDLVAEAGLLERACRLLGPGRPEAVGLLPALASALIEAGTLDRAAQVAALGIAEGDRLGLERVRWRCVVEHERARLYGRPEQVDVAATTRALARADAALSALGDSLGRSRACYLRAELAWMAGRPDDALEDCRRQVELARTWAGFEVTVGLHYQAWSLVEGRTPVPQALDQVRALEQEAGTDRLAVAGLRGFRAVLLSMAGRDHDARPLMAQARAVVEEHGLNVSAAALAGFDTRILLAAGDPVQAQRAARQTLEIAGRSGDRWVLATVTVDLAHTVLAGDRPDLAAAAVAAIDAVPAPGDLEWRVRRDTARALLLALQGDGARAAELALAAVEQAGPSQMLALQGHAGLVLAQVLHRAGDPRGSRSAATRALDLALAKGDRSLQSRLRPLMDPER